MQISPWVLKIWSRRDYIFQIICLHYSSDLALFDVEKGYIASMALSQYTLHIVCDCCEQTWHTDPKHKFPPVHISQKAWASFLEFLFCFFKFSGTKRSMPLQFACKIGWWNLRFEADHVMVDWKITSNNSRTPEKNISLLGVFFFFFYAN